MKLAIFMIVVGIATAFGSLWGGAYALHLFQNGWQNFPSFVTAFLGFIGGVGLAVTGAGLIAINKVE